MCFKGNLFQDLSDNHIKQITSLLFLAYFDSFFTMKTFTKSKVVSK